jgi:DNA mismatch repair protein MutS2
MAFACDEMTLARLEWAKLAERLAACAATVRGAEACRGDLFEATRAGAVERLEETDEMRRLLDAGVRLPLDDTRDLRPTLAALANGRTLAPQELLDVARTVRAARTIARVLDGSEAARLADLAATLPDVSAVCAVIEGAVGPDGAVRDAASVELRRARARMRTCEAQIERHMARELRDPNVQRALQEGYATTRGGRPVLPVRADARGAVRGIVHDISASGTTVFIEPEAVVELGNDLRVATLAVEREIERILREISARVAGDRTALEATGATLERLDLAFARGRLSAKLSACAVALSDDGSLLLRELTHPLLLLEAGLPDCGVANDVILDPGARGLVISGPNAGGKTVIAKAVALAALSVRAGLHVRCAAESRMPLFDAVWADIGDGQDLSSGLSTFSARMASLARILDAASERTLVVLDEIGEGTEPGEGAALAQAALEALIETGATVIATTHFNRLKELAGNDPRFMNASAEYDPETLAPTYRVRIGAPGSSGAVWVAGRMGVPAGVIERAQALLDREDRKLEALTRSLSELRQELLAEHRATRAAREQSTALQDEYEARLARLHRAREHALEEMRSDLEVAFQQARGEIAAVMRDLQRTPKPDGRAANEAHQKLVTLRQRVALEEREHRPPLAPAGAVDWVGVRPGALLEIAGLAGRAQLLDGPDRRGQIHVRAGSSRARVSRSRVVRVLSLGAPAPAARSATGGASHIAIDRSEAPPGQSPACDLRGLRVDEALDRAEAHLYAVLGTGARSVRFIHGHGTGALRGALREWLKAAPGVVGYAPAPQADGGNGVTIASLEG